MLEWTNWRSLHETPKHYSAAVYQMRLVIEGNPFPIPRMLSVDAACLLMMGKTGHMSSRRQKFIGGMRCGQASHSEGNLWYFVNKFSRLERMLGAATIEYRFARLATVAEAERWEEALLKDYII